MVQQMTLVGKKIGPYLIEKHLGKGGMGSVYLAQHTGLDKKVAIKILSRALVESSEHIKRFIQEARTAAKLEHPHIVQVFDVGEMGDLYYIVMQYVEGKNLDEVVGIRGKLTVPEAVSVIRKCASALAFAHKNGIIHRDIKPANILIGPKGVVKVADFGLSKSLNSNVSLSQTGDVMGTPYFMSPEQAKGEKLDFRTDIYSLGTTFYYLLTGKKVFEGETPVSIALKHVTDKPKHVRDLDPSVPEPVAKLVMKMMAKNRNERYQSMDELVMAMQGIQITSEAGTLVASGSRSSSRRIWPWILAGAAGMALLIVVLANIARKKDPVLSDAPQNLPETPQTPPDPPKPPISEPHRKVIERKLKERTDRLCRALKEKEPHDILELIDPDMRDSFRNERQRRDFIRRKLLEVKDDEYEIVDAEVVKMDMVWILHRARVELKLTYKHREKGWDSAHKPTTVWILKDGEWYITGAKKPE